MPWLKHGPAHYTNLRDFHTAFNYINSLCLTGSGLSSNIRVNVKLAQRAHSIFRVGLTNERRDGIVEDLGMTINIRG